MPVRSGPHDGRQHQHQSVGRDFVTPAAAHLEQAGGDQRMEMVIDLPGRSHLVELDEFAGRAATVEDRPQDSQPDRVGQGGQASRGVGPTVLQQVLHPFAHLPGGSGATGDSDPPDDHHGSGFRVASVELIQRPACRGLSTVGPLLGTSSRKLPHPELFLQRRHSPTEFAQVVVHHSKTIPECGRGVNDVARPLGA